MLSLCVVDWFGLVTYAMPVMRLDIVLWLVLVLLCFAMVSAQLCCACLVLSYAMPVMCYCIVVR